MTYAARRTRTGSPSNSAISLREIIADACFLAPGVGSPEWERDVAGPALRKKGWTVLKWGQSSTAFRVRYAICEARQRSWVLRYEVPA